MERLGIYRHWQPRFDILVTALLMAAGWSVAAAAQLKALLLRRNAEPLAR